MVKQLKQEILGADYCKDCENGVITVSLNDFKQLWDTREKGEATATDGWALEMGYSESGCGMTHDGSIKFYKIEDEHPGYQELHNAKLYYDDFKNTPLKEDSGKLPYELEWEFIERMAKRMQSNKGKYEPYSWRDNYIGIDKLKPALSRHFIEIQKGNYEDDGDKYGHLIALACNAMMMIEQLKHEEKSNNR